MDIMRDALRAKFAYADESKKVQVGDREVSPPPITDTKNGHSSVTNGNGVTNGNQTTPTQ